MKRRKRLERANFKRQGWQLDPIIRRKGRYIKASGLRSEAWRDFRRQYLNKLPDMVRCHYCQMLGNYRKRPKSKMTLDHKNGRAGALLLDPDNIVVACFFHNQDKGSTSYNDYCRTIVDSRQPPNEQR